LGRLGVDGARVGRDWEEGVGVGLEAGRLIGGLVTSGSEIDLENAKLTASKP
jgi:hypothetical protein